MLLLLVLWCCMAVAAAGVGVLILRVLDAERVLAEADTLFLSLWIGLLGIAWIVFTVAVVWPVSPWCSVFIEVSAACAGIYGIASHLSGRKMFPGQGRWLTVFLLLVVLVAERSTQVGNLNDTGGYHWSIIRWLNEYGIVPGLGLLQLRLGFQSSWLAFTALFNHGELTSRVATVANGGVFLLSLAQYLVCAGRILKRNAAPSHCFLACAFTLVIPEISKWDMRLSPSPDIPVLLLCVLVGWVILCIEAAVVSRNPDSVHRFHLIPLLLGALAVTIKLNAVPLLVVGAGYALWTLRAARTQLVIAALLALAILSPFLAASVLTTGCLLFPAPIACLDLPWGAGASAAREISEIVRKTAPWNITPSLAASAASLALLAPALGRRSVPGAGWVAFLAAAGIGFVVAFAPTTRFGYGYLVLLPALCAAVYGEAVTQWLAKIPRRLRAPIKFGAVSLLALFFVTPLYKEFVYGKLRARSFDYLAARKRGDATINELNHYWYLWPNRIAYEGAFDEHDQKGLRYYVSREGTCWDHPLPCVSNPESGLNLIPEIALRRPESGFRGGFVRK